ncbi:MAG: glycosyltransferase [Lachnospiraceae bacterium]|nr:glycosyltransferase [Lachnospiraceae bacterium]
MKKEKVSVIIPCYNVAGYIDRCVESIIGQDYGFSNIELILIEDCSSDDTLDHLERIEQAHSNNVLLIKTEKNGGPGTCRNIGMQYSTGNYIVFADGDDILLPEMISELIKLSVRYDTDVSECSYGVFDDPAKISSDDKGEELFLEIREEDERKWFLINSLKTAVWARLYKRDFLERNQLCFPDGVYNLEDVYFSGLMIFSIKRYCKMQRRLYWYFRNPEGLYRSEYNSVRTRKEIQIIGQFVEEIKKRNKNIRDGLYSKELEFYCIWKGFLDPLGKIVQSFLGEDRMLEEAMYFADYITSLFPNAYSNDYMLRLDDDVSKLALKLLRFAGEKGRV